MYKNKIKGHGLPDQYNFFFFGTLGTGTGNYPLMRHHFRVFTNRRTQHLVEPVRHLAVDEPVLDILPLFLVGNQPCLA